jgi:6,7-dimethyl-8-ribityllumazine synthase
MKNSRSAKGKARRLAFVHAQWHYEGIVENALSACHQRLGELHYDHERLVDTFAQPGSLEIPFLCQELALSGKYEAIIAFGLIVNGGIYRHEFVASAVIDGLMRVQLDTRVRIFSCVLTPINFHEHETHHDFFSQHMLHKGAEVAEAFIKTVHPELWKAHGGEQLKSGESDNGVRARGARRREEMNV